MSFNQNQSLMPVDRPIATGILARVSGAIGTAVRAGLRSWFSALPPLPQVAPPGTPTRRWDFAVGSNLDAYPRDGEALGFEQLWALADGYPLLRLVIETRKDQLAKIPWVIRKKLPVASRRLPAGTEKLATGDGERLTAFFASPDGEHSFGEWLRPLAEDLLVGDCLTLEPVLTRGGDLAALHEVSGQTIFPVIDEMTGYTPAPPATAYQQIIKGVVAAEFTDDELIYRPRNRRIHKRYGFSPVEQVQLMINTGLRYELSRAAYYTDGTVPDAYLGVPDHWHAHQINELQATLDANLAGNLGNRRKIFVGYEARLQVLRPMELKTELDEWLARVICYAFSVSPQPFVREMNRATAQAAKSAALEEGLLPLLGYFADLFNFVIRKYFGVTDLEFAWQDEKAEDPKEQADLCAELVANGIITPDEARARLGMEPMAGGDSLRSATAAEPDPICNL